MADEPNRLVSVVVPVHNGERFLGQAIESVLAQDYAALELVIVDDASTDASAALGEAVGPPVRVVRHKRNQGPATARNTGVAASTGELIVFLDADDVMAPGRLRAQVEYLDANPGVGYVNGLQEILLEPGEPFPPWLIDGRGQPISVHLLSGMLRRTAFERVGPFDPSLRIGEDIDWLVRCRVAGVRMAQLDMLSIYRRVHDRNVSHEAFRTREWSDVIFDALQRVAAQRRSDPGTHLHP